MKLAELFSLAERLGAARVATGHYARIEREADGTPRLAMARDRGKDQSYFLYASPREWLERLVFPLGDSTKAEVRSEAVERRLPGAGKGESQELCFVGTAGGAHAYADFVAERADGRIRPGRIVDETGREVGTHEGIHRFTVGQRRGLGVALGRPAFVTGIDPETATVTVGSEDALFARVALVTEVSLAEGVSLPARARVRVRYRHDGDDALVEPIDRRAGATAHRVVFDRPVRAVTSGQVAVMYSGERVIGGGRIVGALASV